MVFLAPPLDDQEISVLAKIGELNAGLRLRLQETRRWSASLTRIQFARAVQGSCAIDGIDAVLDDTTAIDLGEPPIDTEEFDRLAVKGHRDALTYVEQLSSDGDFDYTGQLVRGLHFIMGSYDMKARPGRWRQGPASGHDPDAGEAAYAGPDASDVPTLMNDVVASLQTSDGSPALVRAAMAHLNLVMIQPFQGANGRLGRCLHTLVLARQGVLNPTYGSVEEYLGRNTRAYFDVLAQVGATSWQPERDARAWIRFALTAHLRQAQTLKRRLSEHEQLWERLEKLASSRGLPDRTVVALYDASLGLRVRSATYRAAFNEASTEAITEATASRDLRQSAEDGLLEAVGEKRGRHYRATSDVASIRQSIRSARKKKERSDPFMKRET